MNRFTEVLIILLLIICLIFYSCSSETQKGEALVQFNYLTNLAEEQLELHPDSSLLYADSAFTIAKFNHLEDSAYINIYELKSKAFIRLNNFNSAIESINCIDSIANKTSDSILIVK